MPSPEKIYTLGQIFKTPAPPVKEVDVANEIIAIHKLPTGFEFPDQKSIIGIEVEVENVKSIDPNITLGFWRVDEDGSLRNNGREFISSPLRSGYIEPALNHLFAGINADVDFSPRTSIHIHLNARTFTPENLCAFVMAYMAVENLLFKFAGNNRRSNIYCVPIQDTAIFDKLPKEWGLRTLDLIRRSWSKYTALNLVPLADKGTVEFRHMPGTSDIKRLMVWISMIQKLKLFAFSNECSKLLDTITRLNTNSEYRKFVETIFGEYAVYLDLSNLQTDMEMAVTMVKHCAMSNDFHQNIIANINGESAYAKLLGDTPKKKPQKKSSFAIDPASFNAVWSTNDVQVAPPQPQGAFLGYGNPEGN